MSARVVAVSMAMLGVALAVPVEPLRAAGPLFSMSPLGKCGGNAICFESTSASDLALARKLDPFACKDMLLRPGSCAQYAFPNAVGKAPFLRSVTRYDSPGNHLWFSLVNQLIPGGSKNGGRCGEVDAAPRMPAALFEKSNAAALDRYIKLTTKELGVKLGRCSDVTTAKYSNDDDGDGTVVSANYTQLDVRCKGKDDCFANYLSFDWLGGGFKDICSTACHCATSQTWQPGSSVCRDTPQYCACQDVPDGSSVGAPGNFCSLCGPKYNTVNRITVYVRPTPPPPPPAPPPLQCNPAQGCTVCAACCESFIPNGKSCSACAADKCSGGKTIADVAGAAPDLSTLVAALTAGDLIPTLFGPGPFTVFAPTNEAFAALPEGTVDGLLKPANKAQLADVLTYHVVADNVQAKDLKDRQTLKTVEGNSLTVRIVGGTVFINSARVVTADVEASNGVVHIVDQVLLPPAA